MTEQQMIDFAIENGYAKAAVIDTDKIVFDYSFVKYCAENICGNYGANYTCPPDCGTPEKLHQRVAAFKKALVLESCWKIDDFGNHEAIKSAKAQHNAASLKVAEVFKVQGHDGFVVGASNCTLCSPCLLTEGKACAHPDISWCCMSAYCIHVKDLAEKCGMDYDFVPGRLSLFGMYVFD